MALKLCKEMFGVLACRHLLTFIVMLQCWTAAPSSPPFKSFYWSISSCVGSSLATRPPHYKRYVTSACRGHVSKRLVCNRWRFVQTFCSLKSSVYGAYHKTNLCARGREHWVCVLSAQISQVCQLCQQSPRLFTNHAAQLHTLLVSIYSWTNGWRNHPECCCKPRDETNTLVD